MTNIDHPEKQKLLTIKKIIADDPCDNTSKGKFYQLTRKLIIDIACDQNKDDDEKNRVLEKYKNDVKQLPLLSRNKTIIIAIIPILGWAIGAAYYVYKNEQRKTMLNQIEEAIPKRKNF